MGESVLEPGILLSSLRGFTATPSVVAGTRNLENSTRDSDRPDRLLRVDELVPHEFSLAKKAVAFFSISRSSRRRLFSRRNVVSSERSSVVSRPGFPPPASTSACRTQRLTAVSGRSISRQMTPMLLSLSRHRRTTSALYSNANRRRGRFSVTVQVGMNHDVWLYDLRRDTKTRLTFGKNNASVVWTRDGRQVVFSSNREGNYNLFRKPVDGSGSAERLTATSGKWQNATSVSPDGRHLAYIQQQADTHLDIWVLPLQGDGEPQRIVGTPFSGVGGVFSPNGGWLAYVSDESGRDEVYVRPFPGPGRRWPISTGGGQEPLWSPDGRELFYRVGRKFMALPVGRSRRSSPGRPGRCSRAATTGPSRAPRHTTSVQTASVS